VQKKPRLYHLGPNPPIRIDTIAHFKKFCKKFTARGAILCDFQEHFIFSTKNHIQTENVLELSAVCKFEKKATLSHSNT
jgi:hypothetical protein